MSALVGLFDSGLGGLTVLRRLQERYPHSSCLYLGDTARVPYGQRSVAEIRAIAAEVVAWLRQQQVGVLVMACNTSNALALDVAVAGAGVPVVGLIDSVAAELDSDCVGVLATPATVSSGAYRRAIHACHPHAQVLEVGCPAFVPLIEAGDLQDPALEREALAYLAPLLAAGVDTECGRGPVGEQFDDSAGAGADVEQALHDRFADGGQHVGDVVVAAQGNIGDIAHVLRFASGAAARSAIRCSRPDG